MNQNVIKTDPALSTFYADLHIHIGRTRYGDAVKISGSRDLTFVGIAKEAAERKGIDLIGIIDAHSPVVQRDIREALDSGEMTEMNGGGIGYKGTVILLGTELEVREPGRKEFHLLAYFRTLKDMESFTDYLSRYMKNVNLSSQRVYVPALELQREIISRGGIFVPAHIFTPHKGIYGSTAPRMEEVLDLSMISAVELGLSSDTEMAGYISELDRYPFLTNSMRTPLPRLAESIMNWLWPKHHSMNSSWHFSHKRDAELKQTTDLIRALANITELTVRSAAAY